MTSAFEYTLKAGGLEREKDYPYTGTDRGTCKFDKSKIAASVSNFSVVSIDEDQIAANLVKNGPLASKLFSLKPRKLFFISIFVSRQILAFTIVSKLFAGTQSQIH